MLHATLNRNTQKCSISKPPSYFLLFPLSKVRSTDHKESHIIDFLAGLVPADVAFDLWTFYTPHQRTFTDPSDCQSGFAPRGLRLCLRFHYRLACYPT